MSKNRFDNSRVRRTPSECTGLIKWKTGIETFRDLLESGKVPDKKGAMVDGEKNSGIEKRGK